MPLSRFILMQRSPQSFPWLQSIWIWRLTRSCKEKKFFLFLNKRGKRFATTPFLWPSILKFIAEPMEESMSLIWVAFCLLKNRILAFVCLICIECSVQSLCTPILNLSVPMQLLDLSARNLTQRITFGWARNKNEKTKKNWFFLSPKGCDWSDCSVEDDFDSLGCVKFGSASWFECEKLFFFTQLSKKQRVSRDRVVFQSHSFASCPACGTCAWSQLSLFAQCPPSVAQCCNHELVVVRSCLATDQEDASKIVEKHFGVCERNPRCSGCKECGEVLQQCVFRVQSRRRHRRNGASVGADCWR